MDKFMEKLSSYNLLNFLLPGAIFCYLLKTILNIDILKDGIIENLFVYYFVGMIISRTGSIIIEPIFKKIKLVNFVQYKEFVNASLKDDKVNIFSETNNTYRTMVSLFLLILLVKIYSFFSTKYQWIENNTYTIIIISLLVLFVLSYKKQCYYICNRVKHINEILNSKGE